MSTSINKTIKKKTSQRKYYYKDGKEIITVYCRICQRKRKPKFFYEATDKFLDTNNLMSVCSACANDMYYSFYKSENSLEGAIFKVCKTLNIAYSPTAIQATIGKIAKKVNSKKQIGVFSLYKASVSGIAMEEGEDRTFSDLSHPLMNKDIDGMLKEDDLELVKELRKTWGDYEYEHLIFLQKELNDWKATHKCDNKAEEFVLKQLCYLQLDIQKAQREKKSSAPYLKAFQELMKVGGIAPVQSKASGSGKSVDTFGAFIKMIEEVEPAEFYKNKKMFKDFDGIGKYLDDHITRPIKNFILNSKDYNIEVGYNNQEEDDDGFYDDFDDGEIEIENE